MLCASPRPFEQHDLLCLSLSSLPQSSFLFNSCFSTWWALSRSLLRRSLSPLELAESITNTDQKVSKLKYSRQRGVHVKSIEMLIAPKIRATYDLRHDIQQIYMNEKFTANSSMWGLLTLALIMITFRVATTLLVRVAGTTCLWGKLTCKNHAFSHTFPRRYLSRLLLHQSARTYG